jgi:uncharacterized protein (DUF58 family)
MIYRRRWVLEFFIIAAVAGAIAGAPMVSAAAAFLLMLALAAEWLVQRIHATLDILHRTSRGGVAIGQEAEVWITVQNPQPWPIPVVHFEDTIPLGVAVSDPKPRGYQQMAQGSAVWGVFSVGPHERVRHRLTVTALKRGRWVMGPVRVWGGDPLGWAQFERFASDRAVLTVYPQLYQVPPGLVAANRPQGERRGPPWNPPDPLKVVGIRPYEPGDPLRLVHPFATARTGSLQVKRLEPEGDEQLEILALAATEPHIWGGVDADRFEALVSAAASVADLYLRGGSSIGVSVVGTVYGWPKGVDLPPARGPEQWARVMTAFSWVGPGGGQGHDLAPALARLSRRLRPGAHLMYFACFHQPEWVPLIRRLVLRGIQVTFVPVAMTDDLPDLPGVRVRPWTPVPVAP